MAGNPGEQAHHPTPEPGPFRQIGITVSNGVDGSETRPRTIYRGWTVRIPIDQALAGHNAEWEVLPPEMIGNLPSTIDGMVLDWSAVEVVDVVDFVTGDMIRMFRLPYRPAGPGGDPSGDGQ